MNPVLYLIYLRKKRFLASFIDYMVKLWYYPRTTYPIYHLIYLKKRRFFASFREYWVKIIALPDGSFQKGHILCLFYYYRLLDKILVLPMISPLMHLIYFRKDRFFASFRDVRLYISFQQHRLVWSIWFQKQRDNRWWSGSVVCNCHFFH